MAPQQNTFAVIPAAPGRVGGASHKPPMTSKQAQKLYKQANKEPRRSKAEQRKWEKEKQEEIRKELEKERAAVKARAVRERKKAKEEEARENRRRAGQPLFDCRPSQDTIARFVRGNGTTRKRDSSGEPISKGEDTPTSSPENKPKPKPASLAATTASYVSSPQPSPPEKHNPPATSMAPPPRPSQKSRTIFKPSQPLPNPPNQPLPPTRPSKEGLSVLPSGLLTVLDSSNQLPDKKAGVPMLMGPPLRPPLKPKPKPFMMPRVALPVHQSPRHKMFKHDPPSEFPLPMPSESPLHQKSPLPNSIPQEESLRMPPPQVPSRGPRPKPTVGMPPPKSPLKRSTAQKFSVQTPPLLRQEPQAPPPSTQAIVQDCFDDFFPTASQLAMELEQESDSDTQPEEVLDQELDGSVVAEVTNGELVGCSSGMGNPEEQNQAADNGCREPDNNTDSGAITRRRPSPSARTIYPNSPTSAKDFTTKTHEELQGIKHRSQEQEKQSRASSPPRAPGTRSIKSQTNATRRTMPPPTTPHAPMLPGRQDPSAKTKRSVLQEISSNHSPAPNPMATAAKPQLSTHFDDLFPLICTQDLMMSSQEVLDIESTAKNMTQSPSRRSPLNQLPLLEMDLAAIDWDDDLDDF